MYAFSWPRVWLLLAVVISVPTSASAQYDLSTCNGVLNYCVERARRSGTPTTQCASDYQECQRTGVKANRNIGNPYAAPMQRAAPAQLLTCQHNLTLTCLNDATPTILISVPSTGNFVRAV